ncbi:AraC family transcriptional regulator [Gorillibacterium sp. sgz5001074]|uniref:AraC family transcriptional regulator n=1 Tax=Gorillibacterium sp. sgz5001074 TaxID=3446695 RepID=UPI003F672998
MYLFAKKSDQTWTAKSFMVITLLIVMTICFLSFLLYVLFERIMLQQNYDVTMDGLKQTGQEVSVMAVTASTFAKQLYIDPEIQNLLSNELDIPERTKALNRMDAYRATSPFIDSIYVYKGSTSSFYVSSDVSVGSEIQRAESFYDRGIVDIVRNAALYHTLEPIPRHLEIKTPGGVTEQLSLDYYTFLIYDTLAKSQDRNVIVVNISETQLHKTIDSTMANASTNTFILNQEGILASNSWKYPMLSDLQEKPYVRRILSDSEQSGYFVGSVDGVRSFVSYSEPDYLGWRYVRVMPYRELTRSIDHMRKDTVLIAAAILVMGVAISFMLSKRLFSPADKMLARLRSLESEGRNLRPKRRQDFLRNLMLGWERFHSRQIRDKCAEFEVTLEPEKNTGLFLMQIDDYESFVGRYSNSDRELLKFGIANIAEEICGASYRAAAADLGEDGVAVLVQPLDRELPPEEQISDSARLTAERIQQAVHDCLRVSVSVFLCKPQLPMAEAHQLYGKAVEASYHRLFAGAGCVLDAEKLEQSKRSTTYQYPLHKEKQLLEELKLGRTDQAKRIFEEMLRGTEHYPMMSYRMTLSHLSFEIHNAIQTIQVHNDIELESSMNSLAEAANRAQSLDRVLAEYFAWFDELAVRMEEKKSGKQEETVQRIMDMIDARYMDQGLSLDCIAEELGLSADHIGRLFKKQTLRTILSYITEVRMGKAQELLRKTDLPVGEIAERSGFSNSPYFYKAFKKYHGVSPAEFRKI